MFGLRASRTERPRERLFLGMGTPADDDWRSKSSFLSVSRRRDSQREGGLDILGRVGDKARDRPCGVSICTLFSAAAADLIRHTVPLIILCWGIVMMSMAFVKSFSGLLVYMTDLSSDRFC